MKSIDRFLCNRSLLNVTRLLGFIGCVLVSLGLCGCDKAKKFTADTREGYRIAEDVARQIASMAAALDANDLAKAKEMAVKIEQVLSTRVLSWYLKILTVEEIEGIDAAKVLIAELKKTKDLDAVEAKALERIEAYFQEKTGKTGDLVVYLCALAAEAKFGHGGGGLVAAIVDRLRTSPMGDRVRPLGTNVIVELEASQTRTN